MINLEEQVKKQTEEVDTYNKQVSAKALYC